MANSNKGIQELMRAEKQASEIVDAARGGDWLMTCSCFADGDTFY